MKYHSAAIILALALSPAGFSQKEDEKRTQAGPKSSALEKCSVNSDALYDRREVLEQLARTLNNTATDFYNARYAIKHKVGIAGVEDERPLGFFIYELTDETNTGTPLGKCVELKNHHVYHLSLIFTPYSFSHLVILEDRKLKVFKAINCKVGDDLEEALSYINQKLKDVKGKEEIISRVRNYRKHGIYAATDETRVQCGPVENRARH